MVGAEGSQSNEWRQEDCLMSRNGSIIFVVEVHPEHGHVSKVAFNDWHVDKISKAVSTWYCFVSLIAFVHDMRRTFTSLNGVESKIYSWCAEMPLFVVILPLTLE